MSPEDIEISTFKHVVHEGFWQTSAKYTDPNGKEYKGNGVARSREKAVAFALQNLASKLKELN